MTPLALQVIGAFIGAIIGFLIVEVRRSRKRARKAEDRLAGLEAWALQVSPVMQGVVNFIGHELIAENMDNKGATKY